MTIARLALLAGIAVAALAVSDALEQHLQRHLPAQRKLDSLVDHAHAAATDFANDLEVAQLSGLSHRARPGLRCS